MGTHIIPVIRRLREQESNFEATLGYIRYSRPVWANSIIVNKYPKEIGCRDMNTQSYWCVFTYYSLNMIFFFGGGLSKTKAETSLLKAIRFLIPLSETKYNCGCQDQNNCSF